MRITQYCVKKICSCGSVRWCFIELLIVFNPGKSNYWGFGGRVY